MSSGIRFLNERSSFACVWRLLQQWLLPRGTFVFVMDLLRGVRLSVYTGQGGQDPGNECEHVKGMTSPAKVKASSHDVLLHGRGRMCEVSAPLRSRLSVFCGSFRAPVNCSAIPVWSFHLAHHAHLIYFTTRDVTLSCSGPVGPWTFSKPPGRVPVCEANLS